MKRTDFVLALAVAVLWGSLSVGCTAATVASCRPGDSTVDCCIKKHSLSPAESRAASSEEILKTLAAMEAAFQSTRYAEDEDAEADDFANNADLPEWKQRCIKSFVDCKNKGWMGNCYHCLRRCEGQQAWPIEICRPQRKR